MKTEERYIDKTSRLMELLLKDADQGCAVLAEECGGFYCADELAEAWGAWREEYIGERSTEESAKLFVEIALECDL